MHLVCRDTECQGNELPAGGAEDVACRFCGAPFEDADGNVLAVGVAPLVDGEPPRSFDVLMDALRDAGHEVQLVELTAVRIGDRLLTASMSEDGRLLNAAVLEGRDAEETEHMMDLCDPG